jgi:DNA phosphorothioation-associated putative methyltransferase
MASVHFQPHRTAIARAKQSKPIEFLVANVALDPAARILDFGCGHGADVRWLRTCGFDATGYDAHEEFGFSLAPSGCFDLVTMIYVVNILPSVAERMDAVNRAWAFVKPGGLMYIVSRTRSQIAAEAVSGRWKQFGDGYISSQSRRTFQKGHDREDLMSLASSLEGSQVADFHMRGRADFSYLLIQQNATKRVTYE